MRQLNGKLCRNIQLVLSSRRGLSFSQRDHNINIIKKE
jgi:hypothetical protein